MTFKIWCTKQVEKWPSRKSVAVATLSSSGNRLLNIAMKTYKRIIGVIKWVSRTVAQAFNHTPKN